MVRDGLIRPVDPMMLQFHIWSMTELYAVMGTEVRFMQGMSAEDPLDAEHIAAEITALVLGGLQP